MESAIESSESAARRRTLKRLHERGEQLPEVARSAPEAERLQAAWQALAALALARRSGEPIASEAPAPRPPVAPVAPVAPEPAVADEPVSFSGRRTAPVRGAGILPRLALGAALAGTAVGGFVLGRIVPTSEVAGSAASAATPASAPNDPVAAGGALAGENERLRESVAQLEAQGAELRDDKSALEAETASLNEELLTFELDAIARSDDADRGYGANYGSGTGDRGDDGAAGAVEWPYAPPGAKAPGADAAEQVELLETAGFDEATLPGVIDAFVDAERQTRMMEIGAMDPSADPADVERARARVRDDLVARVGPENFAVARHALGEANRLVLATPPEDSPPGELEAGDVLVAVDDRRVFDLQDIRWIDLGPGAAPPGLAGSDEFAPYPDGGPFASVGDDDAKPVHVLEFRRDGERVVRELEGPLARLALIDESVAPGRRVD